MLNLKKIEVYGFKSFADKVEMIFDSSVTAVVGPNGCGKSNVVDTVRWVLGEQSAKTLRGKTMQDLIFGGTEKRKSMSYCEASLFFDNANRIFPLDFDEVVISRKLYRSGDSEYLLNRNTALLKDISELLRAAGMGRDSYSIIGQGRMDAILSAKPIERRGIFEEALGISNFRAKKKETESKLGRNRDNMIRLFDITSELERQLGPLKKQAEEAKKHRELTEKIKYHEINTYIYNYDNAATFKEASMKRINEIDDQLNYIGLKFTEAFTKMEEASSMRSALDHEIDALHRRETELSVDIEKQSGETRLNMEKINNLKNANARLRRENEDLDNQIYQTKKKLDAIKIGKTEKQAEYEVETKVHANLNEEYSKINEEIALNQDINEKAQAESNRIFESISECNSQDASLRSERAMLEKRLEQIVHEIDAKQKAAEQLKQEEAAQKSVLEKMLAEQEYLTGELQKVKQALAAAEAKISSGENEQNALKRQVAGQTARLNVLREHINNLEGFSGSVKLLLQHAKNDKQTEALVSGLAGNMLQVAQKYEIAINALLGGGIDTVLTQNGKQVRQLVETMTAADFGKAVFLSAEDCRAPKSVDAALLKEQGVQCDALSAVQSDAKWKSAFAALIGTSVIVDNLDTALKLYQKYTGVNFVTLDGDMVSASGSVAGGSKKVHSSNVIGVRREVEALEKEIAAAEAKITESEKTLERLQAEKKELSGMQNSTAQKLTEVQVAVGAQHEKSASTARMAKSEALAAEALHREQQSSTGRIKEIGMQLDELSQKLEQLNEQRNTARADVAKRKSEYDVLKERHDKLHAEVTGARVKLSTLKMNIDNDEKDIVAYSNMITRAEREIQENNEEILQNHESIAELDAALQQVSVNENIYEDLNEVKRNLQDAEQKRIRIKDEYEIYNEEQKKYAGEEATLKQKKLREEMNLENTQASIEALRETIWNEYEVTYSNALEFKDENYDATNSAKEINRLRTERSRLGMVNELAIDSYDETFVRYNEIKTQLDDLKKAEDDLNTIIRDLTKEMVTRFNEGFETINKNFSDVFRELFGGGNAKFTIERDPEKEELEWGIEVEAQPPGKRLQNISLLSGGERAMTAVSILFAILKLRPMPFCMLDEIEAALDEANCERLARYVKKFSLGTQFIMITHKKPTMEMADVLYGVTMEENGVSKMVSVKLTEAMGFIGN